MKTRNILLIFVLFSLCAIFREVAAQRVSHVSYQHLAHQDAVIKTSNWQFVTYSLQGLLFPSTAFLQISPDKTTGLTVMFEMVVIQTTIVSLLVFFTFGYKTPKGFTLICYLLWVLYLLEIFAFITRACFIRA